MQNEEESLPVFRQRLAQVTEQLDVEAEIVLVDDHSTDASRDIAHRWAAEDPRVVYLRLSRNCGTHAAFCAAMAHCTGDCAVSLAADLQDPPEVIRDLVARWREGYQVVWAVRAARAGESWVTRLLSRTYYELMRRLAFASVPKRGADLVLLDRQVIDAFNACSEKNTSVLALLLWMGFRQANIEYVKESRHEGRSKWTVAKKIKLLVDSVVSFSYVPIRGMSLLGICMALCGFLYASVVLTGRLFGWVVAGTGYAALMTVLLVGQGMTMTMLGVLGEYLWRTYDAARRRPWYILEEVIPGDGNSRASRSNYIPESSVSGDLSDCLRARSKGQEQ